MKSLGDTTRLRRLIGLLALAGLLSILVAGPVQAFFPAAPPGGGGSSQGSGENNNNNNTGGDTGSKPPPPGGSSPPQGPGAPGTPPPTGGKGGGVPEIDPGALAGALGLLLSGALVLTDRFRRK